MLSSLQVCNSPQYSSGLRPQKNSNTKKAANKKEYAVKQVLSLLIVLIL